MAEMLSTMLLIDVMGRHAASAIGADGVSLVDSRSSLSLTLTPISLGVSPLVPSSSRSTVRAASVACTIPQSENPRSDQGACTPTRRLKTTTLERISDFIDVITMILAKELRGRDVTANTVAPGPTATPLFLDDKDQATIDTLAKGPALERLGEPQDIANVVSLLAGPARWINGQVIYANGGLISTAPRRASAPTSAVHSIGQGRSGVRCRSSC